MAQNQKPAAQKPDDPTVPKKSGKKLVIGAVASLLVIIAAVAGWYFTRNNDAAHVEEVKVAPPKTPIFVPLEPFTVNLKREESDQYLQLGITMKVFESENEAKIKASLPEIRSKILQLLTTKTATELLTAEGKTQLVKEILFMCNSVIGIVSASPHPVTSENQATVPAADANQAGAEAHAAPAPVAEAASAPVAQPKPAAAPAEIAGIVDVLFTSFIIQ